MFWQFQILNVLIDFLLFLSVNSFDGVKRCATFEHSLLHVADFGGVDRHRLPVFMWKISAQSWQSIVLRHWEFNIICWRFINLRVNGRYSDPILHRSTSLILSTNLLLANDSNSLHRPELRFVWWSSSQRSIQWIHIQLFFQFTLIDIEHQMATLSSLLINIGMNSVSTLSCSLTGYRLCPESTTLPGRRSLKLGWFMYRKLLIKFTLYNIHLKVRLLHRSHLYFSTLRSWFLLAVYLFGRMQIILYLCCLF